jgi:hypothetical protein
VLVAAAAAGCSPAADDPVLSAKCGDWSRAGPVRSYNTDNLYEYIDGNAPFVISFGFRALRTAAYRRAAEPETTVDLYDMGSADNSFALFRSNANLEGEMLDIGAEGAGADARVEFWQGAYYVVVSNPSADQREHVLAMARLAASALPPGKEWPAYLNLLPTAGRVPRSEKYTPGDFLGQAFLKRAVSARYKVAGSEVTLFACRFEDRAEAAAAMARLKACLEKKQPPGHLEQGDGGFTAEDPSLGRVAVFSRGRFLGGMLHYAEGPAADALLANLNQQLGAN